MIIFSTNIAAVQLCHFKNILSNYNKICFVNSSKIHDSVRRPHWSFVINVTSFQPFSLISILLLRLALNPTSHRIDYVYQMSTLGMDATPENTAKTQIQIEIWKIQTQIQLLSIDVYISNMEISSSKISKYVQQYV